MSRPSDHLTPEEQWEVEQALEAKGWHVGDDTIQFDSTGICPIAAYRSVGSVYVSVGFAVLTKAELFESLKDVPDVSDWAE